jgi:chitodextrinase
VTGYRVERCQGTGCSTFAQIATPAGTSFSDTGLTPSTPYSYRVRATDAAGNLSGYSSVATATTSAAADTTPPSAPTTLTPTVVSATQINLTWTASTDNTAVTGYRVEQCTGTGCGTFTEIGTSTTASFSSIGLTASTTYSYRVRATDAAGNLSAYSNTAVATTQTVSPPPAITFLQRNYATPQAVQSVVTVPFAAAQFAGNLNVVVIGWSDSTQQVMSVTDSRGNVYILAGAPTVQTGIATQVIYYAANIASAAAGANSVTVTFTGPAAFPDVRVAEYAGLDPTSPLDVVVGASGTGTAANSGAVTTTSANALLVGANLVQSTTAGPGAGYTNRVITAPDSDILEDRIVTATGSYSATATLSPGAPWIMQMAAFRAAGQLAPKLLFVAPTPGQIISGTTLDVRYMATGDLAGSGVNHAHFQLDGGTVVMDLDFDGAITFLNVPVGSHSLTGWLVRSDHSTITGTDSTVAFSTIAPDTQPPTAPSVVVATTQSNSQINLTWTGSTDNSGVAVYRVERCTGAGCTDFSEIGTATATNFTSGGLAPSTSYSYRVRALDTAGNFSTYSNTATAITQNASVPAVIAFIQGNYATPQSVQTAVTLPYVAAQTAGNLNLVVVGWSDSTSQIASVVDSRGNVYTRAVGPTAQAGLATQSIYYAANIAAAAANANSVTVTFSTPVPYPDIRMAEYSGLDPISPLDVVAGASGTSASSSSGSVSTTSANGLLVGANLVQTATLGAGAGFTNRMITVPDGDILEDRVVTAAATYSATAVIGPSGAWIMQMVAFRAASASGDTQPPTAPTNLVATALSGQQINLTWTASTDNVGVTGYRVERCQGAGCSTFVQVGVTAATSYSDTGLLGLTTYRYRVRATDLANFSGYSNTASATTPVSPPPTLTLTWPPSSVTLSGTVTLMASASASAIGVQFQVDGVNVGPPVVAPFSLSFDTSQFANGSHSVGAYAWDPQRNLGSATPSTVTFSNTNPGNPSQVGLWSGITSWPLVSVHINLLSDGRVLAWDRMLTGNPDPQVWDPVTGSIRSVPTSDGVNLFCAASLTLPDGRLLTVGGHAADHAGLPAGRIFDPATNLWSSTPDMSYPRWYPTVTMLSDGRILTLSGEVNCKGCYADVPEVYDPTTNTWATLPVAALTIPFYPNSYVLPNGRVIVTGTVETAIPTRTLDVPTQTWSTIDTHLFGSYSSAMYLPGKFMKSGTPTDSESGSTPSAATAYVLDTTQSSPQWRQIASMANPRAYHVETLLPDGTVLVTGGGRTIGPYDVANAVFPAELWSPTTETWTTLSSMHAPRLYHGTALLLPDGRVLVSGGGRGPGPDPRDQTNYEIFAPPYLFKGPRPTIASAPTQLVRGQAFTVQTPDASRIAKVTLIPIGSMTHGINMTQRYLPLTFTAGSGTLNVTAPATANLAPPGYYMLFIVDNQGIPSVAATVRF